MPTSQLGLPGHTFVAACGSIPVMSVHKLHPHEQPMPLGWQETLFAASSEGEVVRVAREFVAQFTPQEIADLPALCRPGKFIDSNDITEYAFALVRHRCADGTDPDHVVHKLTNFFSNAAVRLSQILHTKTEQESAEDQRRSA